MTHSMSDDTTDQLVYQSHSYDSDKSWLFIWPVLPRITTLHSITDQIFVQTSWSSSTLLFAFFLRDACTSTRPPYPLLSWPFSHLAASCVFLRRFSVRHLSLVLILNHPVISLIIIALMCALINFCSASSRVHLSPLGRSLFYREVFLFKSTIAKMKIS